MTWYIVTWENSEHRQQEKPNGVVLGVVSATNPEKAVIEVCDEVLTEEVEKEMSPASRVGLANYILQSTEDREGVHNIRVYTLAIDEEGNPDNYYMGDLDFRGPEELEE